MRGQKQDQPGEERDSTGKGTSTRSAPPSMSRPCRGRMRSRSRGRQKGRRPPQMPSSTRPNPVSAPRLLGVAVLLTPSPTNALVPIVAPLPRSGPRRRMAFTPPRGQSVRPSVCAICGPTPVEVYPANSNQHRSVARTTGGWRASVPRGWSYQSARYRRTAAPTNECGTSRRCPEAAVASEILRYRYLPGAGFGGPRDRQPMPRIRPFPGIPKCVLLCVGFVGASERTGRGGGHGHRDAFAAAALDDTRPVAAESERTQSLTTPMKTCKPSPVGWWNCRTGLGAGRTAPPPSRHRRRPRRARWMRTGPETYRSGRHVAHLQSAPASSRRIGTAIGILIHRHKTSDEQAFELFAAARQASSSQASRRRRTSSPSGHSHCRTDPPEPIPTALTTDSDAS